MDIQPTVTPEPRQSFVDKIHGITDKLQSLGYNMGHDSSSNEQKGKSGKYKAEKLTNMRPLK